MKKLKKPVKKCIEKNVRLYAGEGCTNNGCVGIANKSPCTNNGCAKNCTTNGCTG